GGTGDPRPAGSIPVHLRHFVRALFGRCAPSIRRAGDPSHPAQSLRTVIPHRGRCTMKKLLLAVIVGALIVIVVRRLTDA
ncbi:MAG: hypothetical protein OXF65_00540, partial [Acidimicrobiaceae bacterium]|nr:hypothetical protein [Acidimicrobiaceae bacterium]